MITNPNTLGLWDEHIHEVVNIVHEAGGLVYNDGANFNAILGIAKPGDLGIDIMHYNLHKTFSTPHGGGGPGSGPVGVAQHLAEYLPGPRRQEESTTATSSTTGITRRSRSARIHGFHGNFGMHVRAYTYIRMNGAEGLRQISEDAVLAANYMMNKLRDRVHASVRPHLYARVCTLGKPAEENGVRALDIAKRLLDFGVHPPTVYFPLIVDEAMMIEPTETESIESLNKFIDAMIQIDEEAKRSGLRHVSAARHVLQAARRGSEPTETSTCDGPERRRRSWSRRTRQFTNQSTANRDENLIPVSSVRTRQYPGLSDFRPLP
jgi:glycine dehydrogenase subunit 2